MRYIIFFVLLNFYIASCSESTEKTSENANQSNSKQPESNDGTKGSTRKIDVGDFGTVSVRVNSYLVSSEGLTESGDSAVKETVSTVDQGPQRRNRSGITIGALNYDIDSESLSFLLGCRSVVEGSSADTASCEGAPLSKVGIRIFKDSDVKYTDEAIANLYQSPITPEEEVTINFGPSGLTYSKNIPFLGGDFKVMVVMKLRIDGTDIYHHISADIKLVNAEVEGVKTLALARSNLEFFDPKGGKIADVIGFGKSSFEVPKFIIVKNTGKKSIQLSKSHDGRLVGPSFTFLNGGYPGLNGTCSKGKELQPDESCRLHVAFAPSVAGDFKGALILRTEEKNGKGVAAVQLEGTGVRAGGSTQTVFMTSQKFNGDLGGLKGADKRCQDAASAASLPGEWISLSGEANSSFYQWSRKLQVYQGTNVVNMRGESILNFNGNTFGSLVDINTPRINYDEFGNDQPNASAWGIGSGIYSNIDYNCSAFSSSTSTGIAGNGFDSNYPSVRWGLGGDFYSSSAQCSQARSLFCISKIETGSSLRLSAQPLDSVKPGDIKVKTHFPLDVASFQRLSIYRTEGDTAPTGCYVDWYPSPGAARLVFDKNMSELDDVSEFEFTDSTGIPNANFSYYACLESWNRNPLESREMTASLSGVKSKPGTVTFEHTVFATIGLTSGNLGGLSGGDARCQAEGGDNFKAILSTLSEHAKARIQINGPIKNTHNEFIAGNAEQFWAGIHNSQIALSNGDYPARLEVRTVLTGTKLGGQYSDPNHPYHFGGNCNNWSSGSNGSWGGISLMIPKQSTWRHSEEFFPQWHGQGAGPCDNYQNDIPGGYRLYCISQ